jgi:two-component system response regulator DctR
VVNQAIGTLSEESQRYAAAGLADLTVREAEVLALVARGLTAKAVAGMLGISYRTVEVHRARVVAKLGARNAVEAVGIFFQLRYQNL